jgi:hypothetical protein
MQRNREAIALRGGPDRGHPALLWHHIKPRESRRPDSIAICRGQWRSQPPTQDGQAQTEAGSGVDAVEGLGFASTGLSSSSRRCSLTSLVVSAVVVRGSSAAGCDGV